ncbi:MAG: PadR family transcriptional regulator [Candidatus Sulfotelmatobacter sp.]
MNYMTPELGIWDVAILAFLHEGPMHPYQMQRLLRLRHKEEILALKRGSLYHAITRLLRAGLIAVRTTSREGKRPERTIYRITPTGLTKFMNTLRSMITLPRRESSEFLAAMSFLVHLHPEEAAERAKERIQRLQAEVGQLTARLESASPHVARINLIESEYLLTMLKAELGWVNGLEKEIRSGRLDWGLKAILRKAAASRNETDHRRKKP